MQLREKGSEKGSFSSISAEDLTILRRSARAKKVLREKKTSLCSEEGDQIENEAAVKNKVGLLFLNLFTIWRPS